MDVSELFTNFGYLLGIEVGRTVLKHAGKGRGMSGYQYKATRIVNGAAVPPTQGRRLSDRIEAAFDQACEQGLTEIAGCMLKGLDLALLGRPQSWDRRQAALGVLRACHSRLEEMRRLEVAATAAGHEAEVLRPASAA